MNKFNVGAFVWYMYENKPIQGKILLICLHGLGINEQIRYGFKTLQETKFLVDTYLERDVFATKEDLIKYLSKA